METIEYPDGKGGTFPSFCLRFKCFGSAGGNGPGINGRSHKPRSEGAGGTAPDVAGADESNRPSNRLFEHYFLSFPTIV